MTRKLGEHLCIHQLVLIYWWDVFRSPLSLLILCTSASLLDSIQAARSTVELRLQVTHYGYIKLYSTYKNFCLFSIQCVNNAEFFCVRDAPGAFFLCFLSDLRILRICTTICMKMKNIREQKAIGDEQPRSANIAWIKWTTKMKITESWTNIYKSDNACAVVCLMFSSVTSLVSFSTQEKPQRWLKNVSRLT